MKLRSLPLSRIMLRIAPVALAATALVLSALVSPAAAQSGDDPAAILAVASGVVNIQRGGEAVPGSFGAALQPGDVVETGADAQAAVLFESGQVIELGPGSRITIGEVPGRGGEGSLVAEVTDAFSGGLSKFAQTSSGEGGLSALPTMRGSAGTDQPDPIAPRNTLIVPGAVSFTWAAVEDVLEYRVVLTGPGSAAGSHRASSNTLSLPADGFAPGQTWTWKVEAVTPDGPVDSESVSFEVASDQASAELMGLGERLAPLMGSEDATRTDAAHYLMGSFCRSAGFYGDAITHIEVLTERHPDRKELQRELGTLYQAVGRNDKAAEAYRLALKD